MIASPLAAPAFNRRRLLLLGLAAATTTLAVRAAHAQSTPTLRIIVPFPPGGTGDILSRALAPRLSEALERNVIVLNRPGAGGSLGATEAARSAPDGSTLLMGHIGTLGVNPSLYPKLGYDPLTSFAPVAWIARVPNVLVVNAASPIITLKDLIAAAKAAPDKLTYSSGGNGSAAHIAFEALKLRAGIAVSHIPYRGTGPSVTDLLGGQIDATFTGAPVVLPHIKSGKLRALAVSGEQRIAALPEVPTVAESGFAGFDADQWYGLVAPAGLSSEQVTRLNTVINQTLALPDVAKQLEGEGATPVRTSPQAFAELIAREIPRWKEVIRAGNVKVD